MWTYEASGDKSVADENYATIVSWVQFCIHTFIILLPHRPKASHA
jgi:hypothetical protein